MSEFASTIHDRTVFGDQRIVMGKWTSSGATGGAIVTGLKSIRWMGLQCYRLGSVVGQSGVISGAVISGGADNVFPTSGGSIEIIVPLFASGGFIAIGK